MSKTLVTIALLGAFGAGGVVAAPEAVSAAVVNQAPSAYVPIAPRRFADTGSATCSCTVTANGTVISIAGRNGVPGDATAAMLSVTAVKAPASTYLTVWPAGTPRPPTANLNVGTGETRSNGAIVALGTGGAITVFASTVTRFTVDVVGYFRPAAAIAAGRMVSTTPARLIDTRQTANPWRAGETRIVARPSSIPADAIALVANVAVTRTAGPGFVTATAAGTTAKVVMLSIDAAGQTRSATSMIALSPTGFAITSSAATHVVIDVLGYVSGASTPPGTDGLFVPITPMRIRDTRQTGQPLYPGGTQTIPITLAGPVAAVATNLAVTGTAAAGHFTTYAAGTVRTAFSTLNAPAKSTVANTSVAAVSDRGIAVYGTPGAHVIVDIVGYFTGTRRTATEPAEQNVAPRGSTWDPLRPITSANRGTSCSGSLSAGELNRYFGSDRSGLVGADYQRPFRLPDGRVLWMFQDAFIAAEPAPHFVHNIGLIQSGRCFRVLHGGTVEKPTSWLIGDRTTKLKRWFWPLAGSMGADGSFKMHMVEMVEQGASYLQHTVPTAVWVVSIRLSDLAVVSVAKSLSSSPDLFGWSITEDASWTYLYGHCYRQKGFGMLGHDPACSSAVKVARIPKGRFDLAPRYWNGKSWVADRASAVNVMPTLGRFVNPSQIQWDGTRFLAVTKEGDWWGTTVYFDSAPTAAGPWKTYATVTAPLKCPATTCDTYFASFVPWRNADGTLIWGLSNNLWVGGLSTIYRPSFAAGPIPTG